MISSSILKYFDLARAVFVNLTTEARTFINYKNIDYDELTDSRWLMKLKVLQSGVSGIRQKYS